MIPAYNGLINFILISENLFLISILFVNNHFDKNFLVIQIKINAIFRLFKSYFSGKVLEKIVNPKSMN